MPYVALNNARAVLSAAVGNNPVTDLSLMLSSGGSLFALAAGEYSYIWLENTSGAAECCKLTGQAGNTLTVEREQDGTSCLAWNIGDVVECRPCRAAISAMETASATHAATAKTTPADNDEFPLADSAAAYGLKKILWSAIKAALQTVTWNNATNATQGTTSPQFDADTSLATTEFVQCALGSWRGFYDINGSASLSATHIGRAVQIWGTTPGQTLTMPNVSTIPSGGAIHIQNISTQTWTIKGYGTDGFAWVGANSFSLHSGETVSIVNQSGGAWMLFGAIAATSAINASNIGSQSVANADTLDGNHASAFALAVPASVVGPWAEHAPVSASSSIWGWVYSGPIRISRDGVVRVYIEVSIGDVWGPPSAQLLKNGVSVWSSGGLGSGVMRTHFDTAVAPGDQITGAIIGASPGANSISFQVCTGAPNGIATYFQVGA